MKKMLRKIIVLAVVSMLLIMPASTALASTTSQPVCQSFSSYLRVYQYQPDALDLPAGQTVVLQDVNGEGAYWVVPSNKLGYFGIQLNSGSAFITILDPINGSIVEQRQVDTGVTFVLPVTDQSSLYTVYVTALSDNVDIGGYFLVLY